MKIQILCDTPTSWMVPYAVKLTEELKSLNHDAHFISHHEDVEAGEILLLLSCEKIYNNLNLNRHNLVVHESDLPKGKGWSPLTWQILEGASAIKVTLFEASEKVDNGVIYDQETIEFSGLELIDELRKLQANATFTLIKRFIHNYPDVKGLPQSGLSTFYRRRNKEDSKLAEDKSIQEQFNLLRVSDNLRYPAWFEIGGKQFEIHIFERRE